MGRASAVLPMNSAAAPSCSIGARSWHLPGIPPLARSSLDRTPPNMSAELRAVEAFLFREARLMDSHAYDEWLALWTEDARYWLPTDDAETAMRISLVNEDRAGLEDRVTRLKSGAHYAQDPRSRLSRVVANI